MKKIIFLTIVFYFLVLLQTTFLVHFSVYGIIPNLVLLAVIILNLFETPKDFSGIYLALIGGFFLDVYSSRPFGFHIIILIAFALLIKFTLRSYVRIPFAKTT